MSGLLVFARLCLEIFGIIRMAHFYIGVVRPNQVVAVLLSALHRGPEASGAIIGAKLNEESKLTSLQGLAFIRLGFVLQAMGVALSYSDRL